MNKPHWWPKMPAGKPAALQFSWEQADEAIWNAFRENVELGNVILVWDALDVQNAVEEELLKDRAETLEDINICELALAQGIKTYTGEPQSVSERLAEDRKIVEIIDAELERRLGGIVS